ncbi:MAG: glycosyltransferase family 2 protein [Bacteroidia bacterium]
MPYLYAMRIAGFGIIRNGELLDYPFVESLQSAMLLCDDFYISVGQSEDQTKEKILRLGHPQIHVIDSHWDLALRTGGKVLAQETLKVMHHIPEGYDWWLYLQSDEVLHEKDIPLLRELLHRYLHQPRVEGIALRYYHFYGSYEWIAVSRKWYDKEVRIVRPAARIRPYGDAQGFRWDDGRKIRAVEAPCYVYHYGWVRPPEKQKLKQRYVHRFWHEDAWIEAKLRKEKPYDMRQFLVPFTGTHPAVMHARIRNQNWTFSYDPKNARIPLWHRISYYVERLTGWRPFTHRNFVLLRP